MPQDWPEQAQFRENDEVLEALAARKREQIEGFQRALERLGEGDYDVCSNCEGAIEPERREVLPTTTLCSACAGPTLTGRTIARRAGLPLLVAGWAYAMAGPVGLAAPLSGQEPLRVFISVDMEGIGGIGTGRMTSSAGGKDYALGRELMTEEVNTVVREAFAAGATHILVNDSHGDMQNLLHTRLDPRVEYIQGNTKPLGMVQGLDDTYDAAIFLGYHARAGTEGGFLAHTGSGSVKGLWLNGVEVGEGGMNAYYAGAHGVPVVLATGDSVFAVQFAQLTGARTVSTKTGIGSAVARLLHPDVVRDRLAAGTRAGLADVASAPVVAASGAITVRARFATTTRADILQAVPGIRRVDGTTVEYDARDMSEAYALIRLMYKYVSW